MSRRRQRSGEDNGFHGVASVIMAAPSVAATAVPAPVSMPVIIDSVVFGGFIAKGPVVFDVTIHGDTQKARITVTPKVPTTVLAYTYDGGSRNLMRFPIATPTRDDPPRRELWTESAIRWVPRNAMFCAYARQRRDNGRAFSLADHDINHALTPRVVPTADIVNAQVYEISLPRIHASALYIMARDGAVVNITFNERPTPMNMLNVIADNASSVSLVTPMVSFDPVTRYAFGIFANLFAKDNSTITCDGTPTRLQGNLQITALGNSIVRGFEIVNSHAGLLYIHESVATLTGDLSKLVIHGWVEQSQRWVDTGRNAAPQTHRQDEVAGIDDPVYRGRDLIQRAQQTIDSAHRTLGIPQRRSVPSSGLDRFLGDLEAIFEEGVSDDESDPAFREALLTAIRNSEVLNVAVPSTAGDVADKRARIEKDSDRPVLILKERPKNADDTALLADKDEEPCDICKTNKRTHFYIGCAHLCYCDVCVHEVVKNKQALVCCRCNTRSRGISWKLL